MGFLKLPEKEQQAFTFEDDTDDPGEEAVIDTLPAHPRRLRPEILMGIVAALAAVLLLGVLIPSLPFIFRDEDPETAKMQHIRQTEAVEDVILEPTISETEPENPTIPPDRKRTCRSRRLCSSLRTGP